MKKVLLFLVFSLSAFAQGWTSLSNTTLMIGSDNSVCVPDHFNSTVEGWQDSLFYSYASTNPCYRIVGWYNGAVVDTKRSRMLLWGGGHNGPRDNSWISLDLKTISASTATCGGRTCVIRSSAGSAGDSIAAGQGVLTRLNDPSLPGYGCPEPANADGSPVSLQSYGGLVYLPRSDKVFLKGAADACAATQHNDVWLVDMAKLGVAGQGNPYTSVANITVYDNSAGVQCVLDPTITDQDAVLCIVNGNTLLRYKVTDNAWSTVQTYSTMSSGNAASAVVDPYRRMIYTFGPDYNYGNDEIWSISLDSPYTATNITASTTGCEDLIHFPGPGVAYDPSLNRIVGYVPQTAADRTTSANRIVIFDPATMTCVTHPQLGGSGPVSQSVNTNQNVYGHWGYVPGIGGYALVTTGNDNAYTFKLNATAKHGLGSSSYTCVDRDGDGYGTGEGCSGPDADDQDSAVHTSAQFLSKWTTLAAGLQHLGYNPTNIFYLSTTGTDAGTPPDCKNNSAAPCATWSYISSAVACGDMVMLRGGTYGYRIYAPTCTAGSPFYLMGYPGELPVFSVLGNGIQLLDTTYQVVDGFRFTGNNTSGGCITLMGSNLSGGYSLTDFNHVSLRHLDCSGNKWGMSLETGYEITIEDSAFHDQIDEHGIYLTNHDGYDGGTGEISANYATNVFVRNILTYKNVRTGIQMNGRFSNAVLEHIISYNNLGAGFSFETGIKNSILRDSVSLNNAKGLSINQYQAWCDVYNPTGTCPYPQTGNLVENVTVYSTSNDMEGTPWAGSVMALEVGINAGDPPAVPADLGSNTFRNFIGVAHAWSGGYAPFTFLETGPPSTSTFDHVRAYNVYTGNPTNVFYVSGGAGGPYYTCATAGAVLGSLTGCSFGDSLFTAIGAWNNIPGFDLTLQAGSAVISGGAARGYPAYDVIGTLFSASSPSFGAYEYAAAPDPTVRINGTTINGTKVN